MHPILFKLGPFTIYSYGFFYGLGIVAGMAMGEWRARKRGLDTDRVLDLCFLSLVTIIVGARLFYVVQFWGHFSGNPLDAFKIWRGGQVLYGGLLLSIPVGVWYARRHKLDLGRLGDSVAPAIAIGLGIGRLGCFLNGCCYGSRAEGLAWAVRFPKLYSAKAGIIGSPAFVRHMDLGWVESSATKSCPVHPTQLYAAVASLVIAGILLALGRRRLFTGRLIWAYLVLYGATRFVIELFRGDNEPVLAGLTISQVVGIPVIAAGAAAFWISVRRSGGLGASAADSRPP